MIPISSAISGGLTWSKISCRGFELKRNGEVIGTLQRPSFWSTSYQADTASGRWTFRRSGFLCSGSQILESSSQQSIATFKSAWGGRGGTLTFSDGQTIQLECKGWWRPVWNVIGGSGETQFRLHRREKTIELPRATTAPDDQLAMLIMFTWYRILQVEEDAASASVVAAIAAS